MASTMRAVVVACCMAVTYAGGVWQTYGGVNCYNGRGASLITGDNPVRRGLTRQQCMDACFEEPSCEGVVVQADLHDRRCFLRRDIVPEQCAVATGYNMYLRTDRITGAMRARVAPGRPGATAPAVARGWRLHEGLNCYAGHGADGIEGMDPVAAVVSVSHCQELCLHAPECAAITMALHEGDARCFLRANLDVKRCKPDKEFNTWVAAEDPEQYRARMAGEIWQHHAGMNCVPGHGGEAIHGKSPYPVKLTLEVCQWACKTEPHCAGVVMNRDANKGLPADCFMRSQVQVESCLSDPRFDFWLAPHPSNFQIKEELPAGEAVLMPQAQGQGFSTAARVAAITVPALFAAVALVALFKVNGGSQEGSDWVASSGSGSDSEDLELRRLLEG